MHSNSYNLVRRQRGLGLIPIMLIIIVVVIFGTVGMRLFPIYSQFMTVNSVFKDVAAESGADARSAREIWMAVDRRFTINQVDHVKREHISIERRGEHRFLLLDYEVRTNLMANVDAVVSFKREYRLEP